VEAFFRPDGALLVPSPQARSPWSETMLHGRLVAGLAARAVELTIGEADYQLARLSVDLFRAAPIEPVQVTTDMVRDGGRVKAIDVLVTCQGRSIARASSLLLRRGEQPTGTVWQAEPWDAPAPDDVPRPPPLAEPDATRWNPDVRPVGPGFVIGVVGRRRAWVRDERPLVEGEPLSPGARAVMAADLANPLGNWSDDGLHYINADLTVYLARLPRGDWVGLDVTDHLEDRAVALGQCALYDRDGRFGHAEVGAVVNPALGV
jgi:acyl-CoA thioesterase